VIDGWQAPASELCIRGGFVPTDASDRIVILSLWIFGLEPIFGPGTAGGIAELSHSFFPSQLLAVTNKLEFPILRFLVSSGLDKSLVLPIRNLVPVDPVVRKLKLRHTLKAWNEQSLGIILWRDSYHSGRSLSHFIQHDRVLGCTNLKRPTH
jgi:hypothetical protein